MQFHVERLEECESTQEEARRRAQAGAPDGTVVVAQRQTGGHGQHGHAWHSPPGGLYLSLVVRGLDDARLVTLAAGNGVADVLEVAGVEPQLKWVNDVLVEGRKVAGILADAESTGERIDFLVVGIGLNVEGRAADWPAPLNRTAATLEDCLGPGSCASDIEGFLLEKVGQWIERLRVGRGDEVLAAWRRRDFLRGRRVGIDPDGDVCAKVVGVARGVDDDGHLLVESDGHVQAFATGRVFLG